MFGLEKQKKSGEPEKFEYDLEKELKDKKKFEALKVKVRQKMQAVKNVLRTGENQDDFTKLGTVLHGYVALLKVAERAGAKK